jgi:hypothetical protein
VACAPRPARRRSACYRHNALEAFGFVPDHS